MTLNITADILARAERNSKKKGPIALAAREELSEYNIQKLSVAYNGVINVLTPINRVVYTPIAQDENKVFRFINDWDSGEDVEPILLNYKKLGTFPL